MADGFDDNDLRLLARSAAGVKVVLGSLNQPPPFNERRLLAYLELLEAVPEPKDAQLVLAAAREARAVLRAAHLENLGTDKEPEVTAIDRALAGLLYDLSELLLPFSQIAEAEEPEGPAVEAKEHQTDLEEIRQHQHSLRTFSQKIVQEFNNSPINTTAAGTVVAGATATAYLIEPLVVQGFAALFILALLADERVLWGKVDPLLDRQEQEVSKFEQMLERFKPAVETVSGLYQTARNAISEVRAKLRLVRRGMTRIFGKGGETNNTRFPEASPEAVRDLPPADAPNPDLPPPDCTTEDGKAGYLIAGECYPPDITQLRLDGEKDIDFAKLSVFHDLWELKITNIPLQDLKVLSGINSLRSLSLESISASDLNPLSRLTNLSGLSLSDTPINDLTPLQNLLNLQMLSLTKTKIYDLGPINKLKSLKILSIEDTPVSDLSPIATLFSTLTVLHLKRTFVSNLTPLDGLAFLRWLTVDDMPVRDLTPLAFLQRLESLSLAGTMVSDMSPVSGLSSLQSLVLRDTPVSDLTPLQRLENLRHLVLPDGRALGGGADSEENRREVQDFLASL